MRFTSWTVGAAFAAGTASAVSLNDVCTSAYGKAALPIDDLALGALGVTLTSSTLTATAYTNVSVSGQDFYPDATFDYCNVTFAYTHNGRDDQVLVTYWLPTPATFQKRYLSTGGGGFDITSGSQSLPGGIIYGAVAGTTDGGFGSFSNSLTDVALIENGTVNWESIFMFGYQGIHELSIIGKAFTKNFYNMTSDEKLYSYYQGCSEGGREGWSQVQRFADEWDGAIVGAPAFRFAFQQVQHLYSNVVEQTLDYYPPPCELEKIVNETIAYCDPLDGLTDGVVARSDLCKLEFNLDTVIGKSYYCAASSGGGGPGKVKRQTSSASTPEQNGTVSAKAVAVAKLILEGIHDSKGQQVYFSYQPAASFGDAETTYNSTTDTWGLDIASTGGEWVAMFLELQNATNLSNLNNVTYDTLKAWIYQGLQTYQDTLETTWPDLTTFQSAGGKVIHYHGESDPSIPTASSVRYWESVRSIMYPGMSDAESTAAINEWYRLFLVPGAGHCGPNSEQENGPFPQTNLAVMIDWVEKGVEPTTLNATHLAGDFLGDNAQLCAWPLRPLWKSNGTDMECVEAPASVATWLYDLNAFKVPIY